MPTTASRLSFSSAQLGNDMVLLRVDLPYYNYFVLWMIGLLNLIQEHR